MAATVATAALLFAAPSIASPPSEAAQACMDLGLIPGPTFEADEIFVGSTKDGVTITEVTLDEDGEIESFSFTSEQPVGAVLVFAGGEEIAQIFDPPVTEGTVTTQNPPHAISHVHFCFAAETTSPPPTETTTPPEDGTTPPPPPEDGTTPPPVGGVETGGGTGPSSTVPTAIALFLLVASVALWRLRSVRN